MNNAGLNIISNSSLAPYRNGVNTIFLIMTMVQFIIGGIGIPIVYDFLKKFKVKRKIYKTLNKDESRSRYVLEKNLNHKISLFSKLSMSSYTIITLISIPLILISETTSFGGGSNLL
jgi:Trk-type K+ transport system membrane component